MFQLRLTAAVDVDSPCKSLWSEVSNLVCSTTAAGLVFESQQPRGTLSVDLLTCLLSRQHCPPGTRASCVALPNSIGPIRKPLCAMEDEWVTACSISVTACQPK